MNWREWAGNAVGFGQQSPEDLLINAGRRLPGGQIFNMGDVPLNAGSGAVPEGPSFGGLLGQTLPDGTRVDGWGGTALSALQGIGNVYMGMKQYGLAKDSLKENRRQFDLNYDAQRRDYNSRLEDRQRARLASNPTAYRSVGEVMGPYAIR